MTNVIILAAGEGKRIGQPKALLPHKGATLLENVISIYSSFNPVTPSSNPVTPSSNSIILNEVKNLSFSPTALMIKTIIAVINRKVADELIKASIFCELENKGILFVINDQVEKGQLHSIHLGIQALDQSEAGILLHPVDHPFVQTATIRTMLEHYAPDRIIIPTHQGRRGHPPCFGVETIPFLFDAPFDEGARWVYRTHPDRIDHLDVSDPGILMNVNTMDDLTIS